MTGNIVCREITITPKNLEGFVQNKTSCAMPMLMQISSSRFAFIILLLRHYHYSIVSLWTISSLFFSPLVCIYVECAWIVKEGMLGFDIRRVL